jgi:hypothetical protein
MSSVAHKRICRPRPLRSQLISEALQYYREANKTPRRVSLAAQGFIGLVRIADLSPNPSAFRQQIVLPRIMRGGRRV